MKRTRTSMGLRRHLPNPRSALDELPSNRLVSRSQRHRKLLHHFSIVKRGAPAPTLGKGSRCVVPRRSSRIAQPAQAPHSRLAPSTSSLLTVMRPKTRSCKAQASAITEIAEGTIKNPIDLTFGDGECRNCPHDLTSLCDEESSDEDDIEDEEAEGEAEGGRVGWEGVDDDESNDDESDEDEEDQEGDDAADDDPDEEADEEADEEGDADAEHENLDEGSVPPEWHRIGVGKRVTSEDPGEIVVSPKSGVHTHTVVLLHGMYCPPGECEMFKGLPSYVGFLGVSGVKFVFPHAPRRTITWPTGPEPNVTSWYNYFTRRDGDERDHDVLDEGHLASQERRDPTRPHPTPPDPTRPHPTPPDPT